LDAACLEHAADAEPRQIGPLERRRVANRPGRLDRRADLEVRDGLGRLNQQPTFGSVDAQLDLAVGAPRNRGNEAADRDPGARREVERPGVDGVQAGRAEAEAECRRCGDDQGEPRCCAGRQ
jgi:hypothetical protein